MIALNTVSAYDKKAESYDSSYDDPVSKWENQKLIKYLRLANFPNDPKILDIGGGSGLLIELLEEGLLNNNPEIISVDPSSGMLDIYEDLAARKSYKFKRIDLDFESYVLEKFDCAVSFFALQHIDTLNYDIFERMKAAGIKKGILMFAGALTDKSVNPYLLRCKDQVPTGKGYLRSPESVRRQAEAIGYDINITGFNALFHPCEPSTPITKRKGGIDNDYIEKNYPEICQHFIVTF
jgi:SAM-dependent methyltransferase